MMSKSVTGIFVTGTVTFRLLRLFLPHRRHRALLVKARTDETQTVIVVKREHTTTIMASATETASPAWANPNNMQPIQVTTEVIADPGQSALLEPVSTLDEPVIETIMRDVRAVGSKLRVVLLPLDRTVSEE